MPISSGSFVVVDFIDLGLSSTKLKVFLLVNVIENLWIHVTYLPRVFFLVNRSQQFTSIKLDPECYYSKFIDSCQLLINNFSLMQIIIRKLC